MADEGQAGSDAADGAAAAAAAGANRARESVTGERVGTRSVAQTEATWSKGYLVGTSDGKMPTPWLRKWGWWMIPLLVIGAIGAFVWAVDHIEDEVTSAAQTMLDDAGYEGLTPTANWRDVEVGGTLPDGVTADQVKTLLEDSEGPNGEDIRVATIVAEAAEPAPLGEISVSAVSDGGVLTLRGNVPSEAHATSLMEAAEASGLTVVNELTISSLEPSAADADGQVARLAAVLPSLGAGVLAADLALTDTDLTGSIDAADAGAAAQLAGIVGSDVDVTAPDPLGSLDVSANYDGTTIVLDGDVVNADHAAELQTAAAAVVGAGNVINNLNVLGLDEAMEGSAGKVTALASSLSTLDGFETAEATLNDTDLTINGVALDDDARAALEATLEDASAAGLRPGGDLSVVEPPPGPTLQEEIDLLQAELDALQDEIRENVVFAADSDVLTEVAQGTLDKVVTAMTTYQRPVVETGGHTDSQGPDDYNLDLSQRRADSVVAYLVGQGISEDRLRAVGFGEGEPLADNATEDGRLQNRRVEFTARETF